MASNSEHMTRGAWNQGRQILNTIESVYHDESRILIKNLNVGQVSRVRYFRRAAHQLDNRYTAPIVPNACIGVRLMRVLSRMPCRFVPEWAKTSHDFCVTTGKPISNAFYFLSFVIGSEYWAPKCRKAPVWCTLYKYQHVTAIRLWKRQIPSDLCSDPEYGLVSTAVRDHAGIPGAVIFSKKLLLNASISVLFLLFFSKGLFLVRISTWARASVIADGCACRSAEQ